LCKGAYDAGLLDLRSYRRFVTLRDLCAPNKKDRSETWKDLSETYSAILAQLPSKAEYDEALNRIVSRSGKLPDPPPDKLNEMWDRVIEECNELLEQQPVEMWPSMDWADMWAGTWMAIVFHLCTDHPEDLPCNPFVNNRYLAYFGGQAPRKAKTEWPSLAQNYAMVADWLAEHLQAASPARGAQTAKKAKRSTVRGEAQAKLISALTKHHQYTNGGCMEWRPVGARELHRLADVSPATASTFFKTNFEGMTSTKLLASTKTVNGRSSCN